MSREIPQPVRAVAGLAATVLDETRRLPQTLTGLPVRVIGLAMQATMKLQQQYSGLVARGDEVFTGMRGDDEPGLATFDEDLPDAPSGNGVHDSAFDRVAEVADEEVAEEVAQLIDDEVLGLPEDPAPEEVVEALQDITDEVQAGLGGTESGLTAEDALEVALLEADGAPDSALVDGGTADGGDIEGGIVDADLIAEAPADVPAAIGEDGGTPAVDVAPGEDVTADVATDVDVLTPDGGIATVEATVTDEGVAAPEDDTAETTTAETTPGTDATTAETPDELVTAGEARVDEAIGEGGDADETGAAPVAGYDSFTIAQLRGRLRGYQLPTVQELLAHEEGTRAREPYLRMLRNRLEKLEEQAVENSPLAPRGA